MEDDKPSTTARITAFGRAYHVAHERPIVFDDHLADAWTTDAERAELYDNMARAVAFFDPALAATNPSRDAAIRAVLRGQSLGITLPRARYNEDCLRADHAQYLILGAGLDTFAFREPARLATLDVFEVDHPATQRWKRARIGELGWTVPPRLHFLPLDLAREPLAPALAAAGFRSGVATHVAWLGVTYYLTEEAVRAMFAQLAALCGPGSTLVFDYLEPAALDPARQAPSMARMLAAVQRSGEPMRAAFLPEGLGGVLSAHGWHLVENLGPPELTARFEYPALPHFYLARAATVPA